MPQASPIAFIEVCGRRFEFTSQADLDPINEALASLTPVVSKYKDNKYGYERAPKDDSRLVCSLAVAWSTNSRDE